MTKPTFGDCLVRGIGIGQHRLGFALAFFDGRIHEPRVTLRALGPSQLLIGAGGFRRGGTNGSGVVDIADAVSILSFLFTGGAPPSCEDAADANDDASLDISDALGRPRFPLPRQSGAPGAGPERVRLGSHARRARELR